MLFKNVANQGLYIYAHDTLADAPKTGDAANITAVLSKDGSTPGSATATAHPTEIGGGVYWLPLDQSETDCDALALYWASSTSGVQIDPVLVLTQAGAIPKVASGEQGSLALSSTGNPMAVSRSGTVAAMLARVLDAPCGLLVSGTQAWDGVYYPIAMDRGNPISWSPSSSMFIFADDDETPTIWHIGVDTANPQADYYFFGPSPVGTWRKPDGTVMMTVSASPGLPSNVLTIKGTDSANAIEAASQAGAQAAINASGLATAEQAAAIKASADAAARPGDAMNLADKTGFSLADDGLPSPAPEGYGSSIDAIWQWPSRTLTGASLLVAPAAYTNDQDIHYTVYKGGTRPLSARVGLATGADATPSDIASAEYSIFLLADDDPDSRTAIEGHAAVALTPGHILHAELQTDALATAYNFRHVPDVASHPAFSIAGRRYLVEYRLTPTTGQVILVRFRVNVI